MDGFRIPVGEWAEAIVDWIRDNLAWLLSAISDGLGWLIESLTGALLSLPIVVFVIIAALLVVAMTVTMFISQKQLASKNVSEATKSSPMYRQQQMIIYIFPIIFLRHRALNWLLIGPPLGAGSFEHNLRNILRSSPRIRLF